MGRTFNFLAAMTAVMTALGTAAVWLGDQSLLALLVCSLTIDGALFASLRWILPRDFVNQPVGFTTTRGRLLLGAVAYLVCVLPIGYATGCLVTDTRIISCIIAALTLIPLFALICFYDNWRHKICPACCETIKAEARVCRYCRHVLSPDITPAFGAADAKRPVHQPSTPSHGSTADPE